MPDDIDLSTAKIHGSPADIASWPITRTISRVQMDRTGGLTLQFERQPPESWKWPSNPLDPSENYQYTVWAVVRIGNEWHAAGFVQFWQGRPMGHRELPPILTGFSDWIGGLSLGEINRYTPRAGDDIGILVSAGNARFTTAVTSVRERSNVVRIRLPDADTGNFVFTPRTPDDGSTTPDDGPRTPDDASNRLLGAIAELRKRVEELEAIALKSGDRIALRTDNRHVLCAEDGGGGAVHSDRKDVGRWETFTLEKQKQ